MDKEIILMRHGQPDLIMTGNVSALDMKRWIEHYDLSEIKSHPAPKVSVALAASAKVIVSSTAPRALTSVRALGLQPVVVDEVFCEAQLPHGRWTLPRLSPFTWAFILRILWFCGFSGKVESACEARMRASTAAQRLQSLADEGPVLLLGHGIMNRMIANQLEAAGWMRQQRNGNSYWSATAYRIKQT
ncbi:histidine phosphatase family protein [Pseudomonas sp. BBP2017]|uniref:histidine phosphatase family protein n=1 Tax=Pseudomonas sp. BBP2017 TaxID=2109731 RepID=UPI000D121FF6|nr:histidine phosphatase family protein [Pseudomonas sp. BBP2017]PSS58699.1 histidine phosphatase family protein [Pseudomonas sp. BBP2017]